MRQSRLSGSVEGVMGNHDSYSDYRARGLGRVFFFFIFLFVVWMIRADDDPYGPDPCDPDPCGRGGAREHRRERTRSYGTEPARHRPLEMVLASAGRDGAVRPPRTPQNRRRVARAGAWTRSAAAYEAGARSLPPTVRTKPAARRFQFSVRIGIAPRSAALLPSWAEQTRTLPHGVHECLCTYDSTYGIIISSLFIIPPPITTISGS